MTRLMNFAAGLVTLGVVTSVLAGEASTSANAGTGWAGRGGTAGATANYTGGDGGFAVTRTRTGTGQVNFARGLAVGMDEDGLDFSFSHALAPNGGGPAYAGTFNLSIGRDGDVSGSYGGVIATGGLNRSVQAGGATRTDYRGATAVANASGNADPFGRVVARTNSYSTPRHTPVIVRNATPRYWR